MTKPTIRIRTEDQEPDNDLHVRGAWRGLVLVGICLSTAAWGVAHALGWATSVTGWPGVIAWGAFAVLCTAVLFFVGLGLVIGVPWVRYRKRVRASKSAHQRPTVSEA